MHSFAVLDISPGLGHEGLTCDRAYSFKGVRRGMRGRGGGG